MTKVIMMNAPAGAGKDFLSDRIIDDLLSQGIPARKLSLKDPGIEVLARFYELSPEAIKHFFSREFKDIPNVIFGDKSPRQALVHVCENVIKPIFGKGFFVQKVIESIWTTKDEVVIISDLGFEEEIINLEEEAIFADGYLLVRIHGYRNGNSIDFRKDELRKYLYSDLFESVDIDNKYSDNGVSEVDLSRIFEFIEGD